MFFNFLLHLGAGGGVGGCVLKLIPPHHLMRGLLMNEWRCTSTPPMHLRGTIETNLLVLIFGP